MHIPDGFLSTGTAVATWAVSAGGLGYAVKRVNRELGERQVPMMGVTAAFIFAAQMLNFTVAGGTSGHLLGGALAAILLGPWPAMLVLTSVLVVQALLFQDGGLLALGANILNMAVIGVLVGWVVYVGLRRLLGEKTWATMVSGFAAAWLSVVIAALACAVELALSGTSPWQVALPAMGLVHMLIGIGEGLITVAVLAFLRATRPDLLSLHRKASQA
ncbi:MAG: energy-coupling factor ABC transporter permease [Anaerolineae bacterium]